MCTLVLVYLGWPLKQSFLEKVSVALQLLFIAISIAPRFIKKVSVCLIDARQLLDPSRLASSRQILDTSRSIEIPLHGFHFFSLFCIFSLCLHSILVFFFLQVYGSLLSSFPLCQFFSVFGQVFWPFMPLTIISKRGRNLIIECHSSGGVIDLWGELHVKGKKVFDVTNLGGELV